MTKITKTIAAAAVALTATAFASCSQKSSEPSALVAESERIGGEFATLVEESPMYLDSASVTYADAELTVSIGFSDPIIAPADCSQALVEYFVSVWLKSHLGQGLDTTLNTLSAEKGSLKIIITGADGSSASYTIAAARLKKLLTLKPSELNFSAVKDNVNLLMEKRCAAYAEQYKASACTYEFSTGFAQYTLTFTSATAYANLTQDSLRGRYQKVLTEQYDNYGGCSSILTDVLRSLGFEGYRFVYEEKDNPAKTLKAALPWRLFE